MFIRAICGRLLRTQYPCSSVLSVGDSFCCLRFILPQIPQISQISQILYIPVSVFICAICGKLLRPRYPCSSPISVGAILCILRLFSHRFHGFSQMHLEIVLPQIPQIFTDFIYPRIRVHLCYLWEILSHPISVLICDICGSHPLLLEIYSPTDSRFSQILYIPISVFICAISGRFLLTTMRSSYSFIDSEMRPLR